MELKKHLAERHLDLELHRPWLDTAEGVVTFPLWNLSGQMVGYQQYRPGASKKQQNDPKSGRYFTYKKTPTVAVWGVESLYLTPNLVFLTEGVFDACRLTERGFSAVAALSNDPNSDVRNWLRCLNRTVVAVVDNDRAGTKLAKFGDLVVSTGAKDLGDSTDEEVSLLLFNFQV